VAQGRARAPERRLGSEADAMGLRDIALFAVLAWLVVTVPRRPYIGALAWVVFGVMLPFRLSYGMAYNFKFLQVIAILTLVGTLMTRDHREMKGGAALGVLCVFLAWASLNTALALYPEEALRTLSDVLKNALMFVVLLLLLHTKRQVDLLVWALVISIGFYGVKGGIFTLATGGQHMVNGPPDSVISGNNSLAVGIVSAIPLMYYLHAQSKNRWVRYGLATGMALCAVSALGSYSRGALLAVLCMGTFIWWRSHHKVAMTMAFLLFVLVAIPFMPEKWGARMDTIQTYDQEASAAYRLVAWETAYNLAKERFPLGGGFDWISPVVSVKHSPDPTLVMVPHSIYFQVLGSQGFIGLFIYLMFWLLVVRQTMWLTSKAKAVPSCEWAVQLARMIQVALVGYAVGGAFLDIAFWEFPYYLFVAAVVARYAVVHQIGGSTPRVHETPLATSIAR